MLAMIPSGGRSAGEAAAPRSSDSRTGASSRNRPAPRSALAASLNRDVLDRHRAARCCARGAGCSGRAAARSRAAPRAARVPVLLELVRHRRPQHVGRAADRAEVEALELDAPAALAARLAGSERLDDARVSRSSSSIGVPDMRRRPRSAIGTAVRSRSPLEPHGQRSRPRTWPPGAGTTPAPRAA